MGVGASYPSVVNVLTIDSRRPREAKVDGADSLMSSGATLFDSSAIRQRRHILRRMKSTLAVLALVATTALAQTPAAQTPPAKPAEINPPYAPDRRAGEGEGPFKRLIIRGATIIDGTGAPPYGPVDIVIENNRIAALRGVGAPGLPIDPERRPRDATKEIDAHGMYVMPGLVDVHAHSGGTEQLRSTSAEYVYKLWLGHGVTTIRDPGSGNGVDWTIEARARSAANQITAPRVFVYVRPGAGWPNGTVNSPTKAREYVQWAAKK